MARIDPLIRTKMHLPFTRSARVERTRLQDHINDGLQIPLTLVIAPAGFGKTTLVASTVAAHGMPYAWLSLDAEDNREGRFLTYLIAAIQTADSHIGAEASQLLAGIQQASAEAVLTALINDLDGSADEMVLVLDDYHVINNPAVYQAVTFLLEHLPPSLHLIMISRSDPPLPLARLRARSQVVELRAADLRFTVEETSCFLNDVMGLQIDADAVAVLEARTEGWITGLQMAALSMRDRKDISGFIEGFSGTNRYILDYLLEEVLAGQPQYVQFFLLRTSILDRLNASLCDVLFTEDEWQAHNGENVNTIPGSRSASLLEYLEHENLFLVSLDDDHTWFRYHHLLIDLLRARLLQSDAQLVPRLHVQAALWLEQNGFVAEAIRHLLAAGEEDRAMQLIDHYGHLRWAENDLSVMRMADGLQTELLCSRPKAGMYYAWLLINRGDIERVLPSLHGMMQRFKEGGYEAGQEWVEMVVGLALAFLNKPSGEERKRYFPTEQALRTVPANEPIMQDMANIIYGMTLSRWGENELAAGFAERCLQLPGTAVPALAISSLVSFLASIYWFLGRMNEAMSLCHRYLDSIKAKGLHISAAGNLAIVLGEAKYALNQLDEAEEYIRQGLKANEPWNNIMTDAFGLVALVHVQQAQGNLDAAMKTAARFEHRLQGEMRPVEFREDFHTLGVRLQLAAGDLQQAEQWAQQVVFHEDFQYCPDWFQPTLARICLAQGRFMDADEILAGVDCARLSDNQVVCNIKMRLLRAIAMSGLQRMPEALVLLESALVLGAPEGYIRAFLDEGNAVRDLLAVYLRSPEKSHESYAGRLLAAFPPEDIAQTAQLQQTGLVEPLTERELEVLHLMALGKTNQQIAEELVVARGTIKAHAASIYRKLEADNRTEAVAHARNIGILS